MELYIYYCSNIQRVTFMMLLWSPYRSYTYNIGNVCVSMFIVYRGELKKEGIIFSISHNI